LIDLITVVFEQELTVLQCQAQSVNVYCKDQDIGTIYVIVNDPDHVASQINPNWWGKHSSKVKCLPRSVFSLNPSIFNKKGWGWTTQQVLTLLASSISWQKWSLVLDAKTIFVNPLELSNLFDSQNRVCTGTISIPTIFEKAITATEILFDTKIISMPHPAGVPFLLHNSDVRDMISWVSNTQTLPFTDWFLSETQLVTEFILYTGWIIRKYGTLEKLYNLTHQYVTTKNIPLFSITEFEKELEQAKQDRLTASIHRDAWNQMTIEQKNQWISWLVSKNISKAKLLLEHTYSNA